MDDLTEKLRAMAGSDMVPMEKAMKLLTDAADALEAAREDAGRYRWLRNESRAGKGMIPAPILATEDFDVGDCETDGFVFGAELDAAIDDARKEARNG